MKADLVANRNKKHMQKVLHRKLHNNITSTTGTIGVQASQYCCTRSRNNCPDTHIERNMIYRGKDHTCGPAKRKQPIARGGILIVKQKLGTSASLVGVAQPRRKENYIGPITVACASSTISKTQSASAVFLLQHKKQARPPHP